MHVCSCWKAHMPSKYPEEKILSTSRQEKKHFENNLDYFQSNFILCRQILKCCFLAFTFCLAQNLFIPMGVTQEQNWQKIISLFKWIKSYYCSWKISIINFVLRDKHAIPLSQNFGKFTPHNFMLLILKSFSLLCPINPSKVCNKIYLS